MAALCQRLRHICSAVRVPRQSLLSGQQHAPALVQGLRTQQLALGAGWPAVALQTTGARTLTMVAGPQRRDLVASQSLLPHALQQCRGIKPVLRDPDRPKKPMTGWLRYLQSFRVSNPGLKGRESMATAAERWKTMTEDEKRLFQEAYKKDKASYEKQYKEYVDSGKKEGWERPPDKPKMPAPAFFQYATAYRAKNPHIKTTEASKTASALWKDMTAEQKKPYEDKYEKDKEQHAKDMKVYKESGKEEAWKEKVGIAEKERAAAKKKEAAAAKKKAAAEKKKAAAEKKKVAAEKKKKAAAEKKEKKKEAAEKKKEAAKEEKAGAEEKKAPAEKKEKAGAAGKQGTAAAAKPATAPPAAQEKAGAAGKQGTAAAAKPATAPQAKAAQAAAA
uniref:HMG box domain-containing protein n=1 Tax=Alexandrium catenella TaxID=2925 RepID=A0A7S1M4T3_ALECA